MSNIIRKADRVMQPDGSFHTPGTPLWNIKKEASVRDRTFVPIKMENPTDLNGANDKPGHNNSTTSNRDVASNAAKPVVSDNQEIVLS